jgi:hypothetical protein
MGLWHRWWLRCRLARNRADFCFFRYLAISDEHCQQHRSLLMVFLIQNAQNRDSTALQLKLDELIRATEARTKLIGIERLPEPDLELVREKIEKKETIDRPYDSGSTRNQNEEFKPKR